MTPSDPFPPQPPTIELEPLPPVTEPEFVANFVPERLDEPHAGIRLKDVAVVGLIVVALGFVWIWAAVIVSILAASIWWLLRYLASNPIPTARAPRPSEMIALHKEGMDFPRDGYFVRWDDEQSLTWKGSDLHVKFHGLSKDDALTKRDTDAGALISDPPVAIVPRNHSFRVEFHLSDRTREDVQAAIEAIRQSVAVE
ncbi:MAG: hypothetical protein AAGH57_05920 [Pseudomonadota bacterium]